MYCWECGTLVFISVWILSVNNIQYLTKKRPIDWTSLGPSLLFSSYCSRHVFTAEPETSLNYFAPTFLLLCSHYPNSEAAELLSLSLVCRPGALGSFLQSLWISCVQFFFLLSGLQLHDLSIHSSMNFRFVKLRELQPAAKFSWIETRTLFLSKILDVLNVFGEAGSSRISYIIDQSIIIHIY